MQTEYNFSNWTLWKESDNLDGLSYPGVYCLAILPDKSEPLKLKDKPFSWTNHTPYIEYIGMTRAQKGLRSRLKQFDNTIKGKTGHGGADRVRYAYQNYDELVEKLLVSVQVFHCKVKNATAGDLRVMGNVVKHEYDCLAEYYDRQNALPKFNDYNSPKFSKQTV